MKLLLVCLLFSMIVLPALSIEQGNKKRSMSLGNFNNGKRKEPQFSQEYKKIHPDACQGGCDSSCDSGCDNSCDTGCDGNCDSDCDSWCNSSCDGAWSASGCDSSCDQGCDDSCDWYCDTGCDDSCDSECDQSCDSDCGCSSETSWEEILDDLYDQASTAASIAEDTAKSAFDCWDAYLMNYYEKAMAANGKMDETKELDGHAKKIHDKYQALLDEINEKENLQLTHSDIRLARLKKLSVQKQKELGIHDILNDKTLFTNEFDKNNYDIVFNAISAYGTCDDQYEELYDDFSATLTEIQDKLCGALTFSIGWSFTILFKTWGDEVGIALGFGRVGIFFSTFDGWEIGNFGSIDGFFSLGYVFDWNDIAGDASYKGISIGVSVYSFGISGGYDANDNWYCIEASAGIGIGIAIPITYETGSETTYLYEYNWLTFMERAKQRQLAKQPNNVINVITDNNNNTKHYLIIGAIAIISLIMIIATIIKCKKSKSKNIEKQNQTDYQTMNDTAPLVPSQPL